MKAGYTVGYTGEVTEEQIRCGGNTDPRGILEVGSDYVIESVSVHSLRTEVKLIGIKGTFNSVWFK